MADEVVNGFWYNWEYGKVRGATLTLPTYAALILVSFLTLWVQFAGACFFRVLCFVIHQLRSSTNAHTGLFHQQQVILRNSITAPNALWNLVRSGIAWRHKTKTFFRDTVPLLVVTVCTITFFSTASLLSSRITSLGANHALIKSDSCGFPRDMINIRNMSTAELSPEKLLDFNALVIMGRLTLTKSMAYARTCYGSGSAQGSAECNYFVQPTLSGVNSSTVTNATCPFGNNACADTAVRHDSGHIHSNMDLGINSPKHEALTIRRVTTCAPVDTSKYATEWRGPVLEAFGKGEFNTSVKLYEFGSSMKGTRAGEENAIAINCEATYEKFITNQTTFCVSKYMQQYFQQAYTLRASTAYQDNDDVSDFDPVPDFQVPNADVTLVSIFNQANYISEVNDTLYNAKNVSRAPGQETPFYNTTHELSVLGCTEQYQFCNAETEQCTELAGLYKNQRSIQSDALKLSPVQSAVANILWKTAWSMALQWACEILSHNILLAQDSVFTVKGKISAGLSNNHWKEEAWHMHNMSLAVMQRRVYEHATPTNFTIRPGDFSTSHLAKPADKESNDLCHCQKTRSTSSTSISVLGMCVILILGAFFMLLDWVLIQQIFWFRSFSHERSAKKADWSSSGTLQLHKQVLESRGVQGWFATTQDMAFPVLLENDRVFRHLGLREERFSGVMHVDTSYGGGAGRKSTSAGGASEGGVEYAVLNHDDKGADHRKI